MSKYLTNQEIFNKVSKHLIAQGKQCVSANGDCVYRGPKNLKCAIGCLIPDEFYEAFMENKSIHILFGKFPVNMKESKLKKQSGDLLFELQKIHDNEFRFLHLKTELKKCATEFRLNSKVLGKV